MARSGTPIVKGMESGETVHKFIDRKIRPDTMYLEKCGQIINDVVRFLERKGSPLNVKRIVKSGSMGKGTAVREMSDIDLIIFLNGYGSVAELSRDMHTVLTAIKNYASEFSTSSLVYKAMTPFSVQFHLKTRDGDIHEVDLLPAVDITETMTKGAIYEQMKEQSDSTVRGLFSACLSPFQIQFVALAPAKVKDLIRFLKYWAKVEDVTLRSYFLELIVINHWRQEHQPHNFDINIYFRRIMEQIAHVSTLQLTFQDNYNYRIFRGDLKAPYLLDPANPYKNVAPSSYDVKPIAQKANAVLQRL